MVAAKKRFPWVRHFNTARVRVPDMQVCVCHHAHAWSQLFYLEFFEVDPFRLVTLYLWHVTMPGKVLHYFSSSQMRVVHCV